MAISPDAGGAAPTIGILCGGGLLPLRVAESFAARGSKIVVAALEGEADEAIEDLADEVTWTGIAKLGRWVRVFKAGGVELVFMCGGVRKDRMFTSKIAMLPDWRTIWAWHRQMAGKQDHTILGVVADEFEKEGFKVCSVADYCPELLIPAGCVTTREPTRDEWRDIRFGWPLAKRAAALQFGQCIVVKEEAVIAVEGIDGTDATLRRAGRLTGGGGAAIKVPKEGHDIRFDIPCIGPDTVETLGSSGVLALAVQAGGTIVLDEGRVRSAAEEAGVCIVGVAPEQMDGTQ